MTDESLWSTRNVAEYAYCPRLFYFMEVEGIHIPNSDTELGKGVHRRVDKPSAEPKATEPDDDDVRPTVVRSLTLSSSKLGLTATLDLAELMGNRATPIEYRKGRPQLSGPVDEDEDGQIVAAYEPWPTDRVQVALQALLLKEAGYEVEECIIYYAKIKRRLVIPLDAKLVEEALECLDSAKHSARGPRPLPLINDARCLRCSLQPICLPDEVNQQRLAQDVSPRKIWPPRDDGIHVVAQTNGTKVGVSGLSVKVKDKDGKLQKEIPLTNIESLSLLGSVQISTQAVHVLADHGVPIAFLSAAGRMIALIDPLDSVSERIRRSQVLRLSEVNVCLELSRALVTAKISNQRTILMRNNNSLPSNVLDLLSEQSKRATGAQSLDVLRGHEGMAAAAYFANFSGMIKCDLASEFQTHGRQRRPPPDPINACLSLAYTMLTHECVAALRLARLEPSIGAYHTSRPGRPAFALDLMEPFRPLIADSLTLGAFNRGELTEGHFMRTAAGCSLTDAGRKSFFDCYGRRMDTEITHPIFGYRLSYRRMLVLHARLIAAYLMEEFSTLSFLTTR